MHEPRQKVMERIGAEGCYFLSIVFLAEVVTDSRIDAVSVYLKAVASGWLREDCLVTDPAGVMRLMTGISWTRRHEPATYRTGPGEYEILKYTRKTGSGVMNHFVVGDFAGGVEYDPYGESRTVREGTLESKRIFSRA